MKKIISLVYLVFAFTFVFAQNDVDRSSKIYHQIELGIRVDFSNAIFRGNQTEKDLLESHNDMWAKLWKNKKNELTTIFAQYLQKELKRDTRCVASLYNDSCRYCVDVYINQIDPDGEIDATMYVVNRDEDNNPVMHKSFNCNGGNSKSYENLSDNGFIRLGEKVGLFLSSKIRHKR